LRAENLRTFCKYKESQKADVLKDMKPSKTTILIFRG
jgi:hypothetical protein